MKVVALTPISSAYTLARYSAFAHRFSQISFSLLELGESSLVYQWQPSKAKTIYPRILLSNEAAEGQSSVKLFRLIKKTLDKIRPDVVVLCGYGVHGMKEGLLWCLLNQCSAVLLSESKQDDAPRSWLTETLKRFLLKLYQSALVGGRLHRDYLVQLGMNPASVFLGYDVVGNDDFHPQHIAHLPNPYLRPFFLTINRFIPKKNLTFLITAYAEYRERVGDSAWDLVLAGDGELRPQLEQQMTDLNLNDVVYLPGFLQQEELLPYFAHAKCFIHASIQEQWGLVVNEAMGAGLPVLVSNRCGCFEDLILEDINGFGFDPENQEQLTQLMVKMSSDTVDLSAMGQAALNHIQKYSPDYFAQGLMQAVEYALAHT